MSLEYRQIMGSPELCLVLGSIAYPLTLIPDAGAMTAAELDVAISAYPRRSARTAWLAATPEERAAALAGRP